MADERTIKVAASQDCGVTDYHYFGLKDGRWGYRYTDFELGGGRPIPKEAISR